MKKSAMTIAALVRSFGMSVIFGRKASSDKYQAWLRAQGVRIGEGVHLYSPWTIRVDTQRPWMIDTGNSVSMGQRTLILECSDIGTAGIVGAGFVVSENLPSGGIYTGAPERLFMSIDDFQSKRRSQQFSEARDLVQHCVDRFGRLPERELLREIFWLFESRTDMLDPVFAAVHTLGGNQSRSDEVFTTHRARLASFEGILTACLADEE